MVHGDQLNMTSIFSSDQIENINFITLRYASLYKRGEVINHGLPCEQVCFHLKDFGCKLAAYCLVNCFCLDLNKVYTLEQDQFIHLMRRIDNMSWCLGDE